MKSSRVKGSRLGKLLGFPLLGSALLTAAWLTGGAGYAMAQAAPPACQQPRRGEYLVLVISETKDSQQQIRRSLPAKTKTTVCKYVDNNIVTRIGGFRSVDDAKDWVRYVKEIVGLPAFIARQPAASAPASPSAANNKPPSLGNGYAVLVDSSNQPQVAEQVRQIVGGEVGLVSYGQRSYLLAVHTTSQREANSTLQQLSDRGFLAQLVNSRQVTLLKAKVSTP